MTMMRPEASRLLAGIGLMALAGLATAPSGSTAPASLPAAASGAWESALRDARNVDVNQAHASELERLPGIGPALAGRIVAERQRRGRFTGPGDLLRVRGIGPATIEKIENYLAFE